MKLSQKDIEEIDKEMTEEESHESEPAESSQKLADTEKSAHQEYEEHEHNDEDEAEYDFDFFATYRDTKDDLEEDFEEFMHVDTYVHEGIHVEIDDDDFRGKGHNINALPRSHDLMSDGEYLKERLEDQMHWFDRKSTYYQRRYKKFKHWEFIIAAFIPVVITFSAMSFVEKAIIFQSGDVIINLSIFFQVLAALGGVMLVIFNKYLELEEAHKLWKDYRANAEALQFERMRYLTRTEPYDEADAYPRLVERVEHVLNRENLKWQQRDLEPKGKKRED